MFVQQSVFRSVRMVGSVLDRVPVIVLRSGKDSSVKHVRMMEPRTSCFCTAQNASAMHSAEKSSYTLDLVYPHLCQRQDRVEMAVFWSPPGFDGALGAWQYVLVCCSAVCCCTSPEIAWNSKMCWKPPYSCSFLSLFMPSACSHIKSPSEQKGVGIDTRTLLAPRDL